MTALSGVRSSCASQASSATSRSTPCPRRARPETGDCGRAARGFASGLAAVGAACNAVTSMAGPAPGISRRSTRQASCTSPRAVQNVRDAGSSTWSACARAISRRRCSAGMAQSMAIGGAALAGSRPQSAHPSLLASSSRPALASMTSAGRPVLVVEPRAGSSSRTSPIGLCGAGHMPAERASKTGSNQGIASLGNAESGAQSIGGAGGSQFSCSQLARPCVQCTILV